jgi:hypothetical protein
MHTITAVEPEMTDKNKKFIFEKYSTPGLTLGYTSMAAIIFFSFLGYQIDAHFKTQYWTLIGIFVGFFFSGYEVWKLIKSENAKEKEKKGK